MSEPTVLTCSADEYLWRRDWADYELVDGILVPRHGGALAGAVGASLGALLGLYCREHRLGHVFGFKCPYRCFPGRPDTVRRPSLSVVRNGRLPGEVVPKDFLTIAPDLAVEIMTPLDTYEEVEAKVGEYRSVGVRLVWVVSPGSKTVLVRRPDGSAAVLDETGALSGEDVVPGFACKVADLFV